MTALHNHFFWEQPRIFYMHVHGMGRAAELARKIKPAVALIDAAAAKATAPPAPPAGGVTGATLATIIGTAGEQNGPVYKITIGRPDIDLREHGAKINARMGLNTWAAFSGSDADAMVAGDVAMLDREVQPVLKALRANGLSIVAIHHHMTGTQPAFFPALLRHRTRRNWRKARRARSAREDAEQKNGVISRSQSPQPYQWRRAGSSMRNELALPRQSSPSARLADANPLPPCVGAVLAAQIFQRGGPGSRFARGGTDAPLTSH